MFCCFRFSLFFVSVKFIDDSKALLDGSVTTKIVVSQICGYKRLPSALQHFHFIVSFILFHFLLHVRAD